MVTSLKRYQACTAALSSPSPAAGQRPPLRLCRRFLDTHRQVSVGSLFLSTWSLCPRFCLCPSRVYFLFLCQVWQLYSGVNGHLLQQDLCHMHTQNPRSCGGPLPTHTSTGDAQTQFYLSLCGIPGSWCAPGLFEPSEHLCWEWGLILKVNLPLLPSYWGFSFALGCGASSHSHSSAYHVTVFFFFFFTLYV